MIREGKALAPKAGECQKARAIEVLTKGWTVADKRGEENVREAMAKLLVSIGAPIPAATNGGNQK